jgi:hypothetical protein
LYDFAACATADGIGGCNAAVRSALLDVADPHVFLLLSLMCEPFCGVNHNNNGIDVRARENAWLTATVISRFAQQDKDKALCGGLIENHSNFIDKGPHTPWSLTLDMLQKMNMHVLCVKAFDMEATATPLLRTRAIVFFWRAAPWETPGVCCVEKNELL